MKTKFNFFIISTAVFILSVIAICCAPIINKLFYDFENWKSLNCDLYSDLADSHEIELKDEDNYRYLKNLCRRQKATYNLEYASLTISTSLSFICFYLSLLLRLNIGKEYKNNIGLIGFIFGIICFILTLIYLCFSGYIFTNDIAFGIVEIIFGLPTIKSDSMFMITSASPSSKTLFASSQFISRKSKFICSRLATSLISSTSKPLGVPYLSKNE